MSGRVFRRIVHGHLEYVLVSSERGFLRSIRGHLELAPVFPNVVSLRLVQEGSTCSRRRVGELEMGVGLHLAFMFGDAG